MKSNRAYSAQTKPCGFRRPDNRRPHIRRKHQPKLTDAPETGLGQKRPGRSSRTAACQTNSSSRSGETCRTGGSFGIRQSGNIGRDGSPEGGGASGSSGTLSGRQGPWRSVTNSRTANASGTPNVNMQLNVT